MKTQLQLTIFIVYFGLVFVHPYDRNGYQLWKKALQTGVLESQNTFNNMKDELQRAQNTNIHRKKSLTEKWMKKRETNNPDESEETMPPSNPRKAFSDKQTRLIKTSNAETELVPKKMMELLRKKIPHHEHQLPAIPNTNDTQQNCRHCEEYRELVDRYHNIFKKLMGVKDDKLPAPEEEEMTFDEALRKAPGWLLCLAKSKTQKVQHKLEEAKIKFSQVFDLMNKEAGDVAGEITDVYSKICRRLDMLCEKQESSTNQDDPEEFMRREILRRFNIDGEPSRLKD